MSKLHNEAFLHNEKKLLEVTKYVEGDNKRNVVFLEIKPQNISNDGYFLDPWGTPYVLNLVNPSNLWAYSFGKNKIDEGGNGDDVASWK